MRISLIVAADLALVVETSRHSGEEIFIIGGLGIYTQALKAGFVDRIYLTRVHARVDGDVAMPPGWLDRFELVDRPERTPHPQDEYGYELLVYERRST